MAMPRLPADGKQLAARQEQRLARLHEAVALPHQYRNQISGAADRLLDRETDRLLAQIPVETLNQEKRGIRVKTLRDSGYDNMEKLRQASRFQLEAISGISPEGAFEIKKLTDQVAQTARAGARIRLSRDDRSPEATALVLALSRYRDGKEPGQACGALINGNEKSLVQAIRELNAVSGSLQWLFAGRAK